MKISVVIPTYNRRKTLRLALKSVVNQTLKADEVIVVDDGSNDGTAQMLDEFPVKVVSLPVNRGVSVARNAGIEAANNPWIAFLDSDDQWLPRKLEEQVKLIEANSHVRLVHCDEIWIRNGRRVNPMRKHRKSGGALFCRSLAMCLISPSAVMVKRDVFEQFGVFDTGLPACEDYDLWLRVTSRIPVYFVDQPLVVKTGGHSDQLSKRYWGMDRFRIASLDTLLKNQALLPYYRQQAIRTLIGKAEIYLTGALKRQKTSEIKRMKQLIGQYQGEIS